MFKNPNWQKFRKFSASEKSATVLQYLSDTTEKKQRQSVEKEKRNDR